MKKILLLSLLPLFLMALSGCAVLGDDGFSDPTSDEGVAELAMSRLNGDSMTARSTLNTTINRGVATLYGSVPDQATRMRAIQILEATPGIYHVVDHTRRQ
jgi:osmotically-inducible protein OsmY